MTSLEVPPISWSPSEYWDGYDGSWSSFALQVGYPPQVVRVLPSTAGQAIWVITPQGCPADFGPGCTQSRGGVFDSFKSETWSNRGYYPLALETNIGYKDNGTYGLDTVALGFSNTTGEPWLESHLISEVETIDFPLGLFGLGRQQTNLSAFDDGYPSFLTRLKTRNMIPSLSWSYTAGAQYRLKGVFGSLTFGGYDSSRFETNNVSFALAPDISRDLVVGLQAITSTSISLNATTTTQLLPSPILTFIDSTLPWIFLPSEACRAFEKQFGIQYNSTLLSYVVSDKQHSILMATNPSITFTIADSKNAGPTVDIVLPYSSFDLEYKPPLAPSNIRYFPIMPAQNESQYTLGRTFLQEAYLTVNYERSNFSISQCVFEDGVQANIVPIRSADTNGRYVRNFKSIVGGTVGAVAFLLLSFLIIFLMWRKRQHQRTKIKPLPSPQTEFYNPSFSTLQGTPKELGENSLAGMHNGFREMDSTAIAELAQLSRSMLQSQSTEGRRGPFDVPSMAAISGLELSSPAVRLGKGSSLYSSERNQYCQSCEDVISPVSTTSKFRVSFLNRKSLPPTPRHSNSTVIQMYDGSLERSDDFGGKLSRDDVEKWRKALRASTPS